MKKRICASFLVITILSCIIGRAVDVNPAGASTVPEIQPLESTMIVEERLVEAYNNMLSNFERAEDGQIVYPIEYAGAYIDEGKLCIALTEDSSEIQEKYKKYCGTAANIEFVLKTYPLSELEVVASSIKNSDIEGVTSISIRQKENKLYLGVDSKDISAKTKELSTFSLEGSDISDDILKSVVVEYFPEVNINTDDEVNYENNITAIASIPDLVGGIKLVRNGGQITLGVCGTYRNSSVILTCGHGCSVGDTVYSADGTLVGTVVKQQFDNAENYDYAIVGLTSAATSSVTSKVKTNSGTQNITSSSYSAVEGMSIKCYGQKSGYKTGTVTAINVGRSLSGKLIEGLVEVSTSSAIQGGDSGGPVFAGTKMYGTISGPQNATVWCFSPAAVVSGFSV